jgi:hypothetical protein
MDFVLNLSRKIIIFFSIEVCTMDKTIENKEFSLFKERNHCRKLTKLKLTNSIFLIKYRGMNSILK